MQGASMGKGKKRIPLNGKTWMRYSLSLWDDVPRSPEERSIDHPSVFPRELVGRLLKIFTRPGDLVVDPFMGSGTTLVEAYAQERRALGLDVCSEYVETARRRLRELPGGSPDPREAALLGDARELDRFISRESVDFFMTSPPYWNILSQKRSADKREIQGYRESDSDLSLLADYAIF